MNRISRRPSSDHNDGNTRRSQARSSKRFTNDTGLGISIYAPEELPASVKAVLKGLYPNSKYTKRKR